jgi:hypothetical protein
MQELCQMLLFSLELAPQDLAGVSGNLPSVAAGSGKALPLLSAALRAKPGLHPHTSA